MPTSKAITASKFLGKDRYEYYLNELLTEQTLGGQKLSKQQLKEAFSKRSNKISFENFVSKVISTKTAKSAVAAGGLGPNVGPAASGGFGGGGGGALVLVKSPRGALQKYVEGISKNSTVGGGIAEDILAIKKSVISIAEILANQQKQKKNAAAYERRRAEQEKRGLEESKLEKTFKGIAKTAKKIIAPVKSLLDRILNFIGTVILGRIVFKIIEWFGDKNNADKVKSIIRFFSDWGPTLLSLYIVFGTSFGKFARGLISLVIKSTVRLGAAVAALAVKAGIGKKGGKLSKLAGFLGGRKGKLLAAGLETAITVGGTIALSNTLKGDGGSQQKAQGLSGGGYVRPRFRAFSGGGFNFKGMMGGAGMGAMFGPLGMLLGGAMGGSSGFVSGPGGPKDDKIPAMLSDGEFVMSAGAVQKYGVDTFEQMNAAGGGTNKPKIISGTTYAADGGPIGGRPGPGSEKYPSSSSGDPTFDLRKHFNNFIKSRGAGPNFDIGNPSTWRSGGGGGTSASGGGGSGGFLSGMGYFGRSAQQVPKIIGSGVGYAQNVAGEALKLAAPSLSTLQRLPGEAQKLAAPAMSKAQQIYGGVKQKVGSTIDSIRNFDFSGLKTLGSNIHGAATEAVPALLASTLGISRTDKSISQDMQRAILEAQKNAARRGQKNVDYGDYAGGGLSAAGLTMGRIGNDEFKRDEKGRIIGIRQIYDTNRSARDAMRQAGESFEAFKNSGFKDMGSLGRAAYKPFEALLAKVQNRGMTMHDVDFDEKVLGFKPGKEVLNDRQKNMIAEQKNREALQNKRPWWDKMGLFGGATAEMQRQQKNKPFYGPGGDPSGSGQGQVQLAKRQPRRGRGARPVKPPAKPAAKVVYGPPAPKPRNRRGQGSSGTRTPSFSASSSASSNAKLKTLGVAGR